MNQFYENLVYKILGKQTFRTSQSDLKVLDPLKKLIFQVISSLTHQFLMEFLCSMIIHEVFVKNKNLFFTEMAKKGAKRFFLF